MSPQLQRICRLFPDHTFFVSRLARDSKVFVSLCEEFGLAVDALERLEERRSHSAADLLMMAEYRALIEELKMDLLRELKVCEESDRG